jgi:hypothetical protein
MDGTNYVSLDEEAMVQYKGTEFYAEFGVIQGYVTEHSIACAIVRVNGKRLISIPIRLVRFV